MRIASTNPQTLINTRYRALYNFKRTYTLRYIYAFFLCLAYCPAGNTATGYAYCPAGNTATLLRYCPLRGNTLRGSAICLRQIRLTNLYTAFIFQKASIHCNFQLKCSPFPIYSHKIDEKFDIESFSVIMHGLLEVYVIPPPTH